MLPSGLELFVDRVVPILRERGLFRSEYEGTTLREHYGLPRPVNQYFDAPTAEVEVGAGESADAGRSAAALVDAR